MDTKVCRVPIEDITAPRLIMLLTIGVETILGAWINGFIVTICCIDKLKKKSLSGGDQILVVLATNRFCFLVMGVLRMLCRIFSPTIYYKDFVYRGIRATIWFFISSSHCLAACLCLFYCVKIANFNHSFFIFLKLKVSRAVPALLLSSELLSFVSVIPFFKLMYMPHCDVSNATALGNVTTDQISKHTSLLMLLFLCVFGFLVVCVLFVVSAALLLISLWRHARQLRETLSSYASPGMVVHVRAVKIIMYFMVTYLVGFVFLMLALTERFQADSDLSLFCAVVINGSTSIHSIVLILTNPKFKKAFLQTLQRVISFVSVKCFQVMLAE